MAQSFFQAGARSLLLSLWAVDDEATTILMERFYRGWLQHGLSRFAALQQAQQALREHADGRFAHPYYWAAFVLVGGAELR